MVNNLGVDPDEWFRESIPMNEDPPYSDNFKSGLPDGGPNFSWEDTAPCEYEPDFVNPLDSMPIATYKEDDWFTDKPKQKEETMHEKMYNIATARNNPFHVGGSENAQSDIDYVKKHSPWPGGSENFQGGSERIQK